MSKQLLSKRWEDPNFVAAIEPRLKIFFGSDSWTENLDLGGITVGLEGPVKYLWDQSFMRKKISNVDLSSGRFSAGFNLSQLSDLTFKNAFFDNCAMDKSVITNCIFDNADVRGISCDDSVFQKCSFRSTKIRSGIPLGGWGGKRVRFEDCDFTDTTFRSVLFRASVFQGCVFENTHFHNCDMRGAKFFEGVPDLNKFSACETKGLSFDGREVG